MERKNCPFCGEQIALAAKKCRFCGEWLPEESMIQTQEQGYELAEMDDVDVEVPEYDENASVPMQPTRSFPASNPNQATTMMTNQQPNQGLQQNIVVQPQIVVENHQEVTQEQNVIIQNGDSESSSGCLWAQIAIVSIGLGFVFHGFWSGVAAFIILAICIFVPFLGHALCVILGLAFGVLAGVTASAFGAATWIAWLIGIVFSVGLIYGNLEYRNSD